MLVLLSLVPFRDLENLYQIGIWLPPLAALASAVTVLASVASNTPFLSGRAIRWFGAISYSLYLWHAPLMQIPGLADSRLSRLLAVGVAIVAAWLSWSLIERPILGSRLRQRFVPQSRVPSLTFDRPI